MRAIIAFLLSLTLVSSLEAEPLKRAVRLQVVYLSGPYALTPTQAFIATHEALSYIRMETGVEVTLEKWIEHNDPSSKYNDFLDSTTRLAYLGDWAKRHGILSDKYITHFILPPLWLDPKTLAIAGYSQCECSVGKKGANYSESNALFQNVLKEGQPYRYTPSVAAIAHEILHQLGASHAESATIMHPNALALSIDALPHIDPVSMKQINRCLTNRLKRSRNGFAWQKR